MVFECKIDAEKLKYDPALIVIMRQNVNLSSFSLTKFNRENRLTYVLDIAQRKDYTLSDALSLPRFNIK